MGRILTPYGGASADLDAVTALASDVLQGKVIVGPDGEPLTGTIPTLSARTITPGTGNQVIAGGNYLAGNITVAGDADLAAGNIRIGRNIFGVAGNVKPLYQAQLGVMASGSMTMKFNNSGNESHTVGYYTATVPANVKVLYAMSMCAGNTEYGSALSFSTTAWNFVFIRNNSAGSRLYPSAVSSYRYQSGTTVRIPLSPNTSQSHQLFIIGEYTS